MTLIPELERELVIAAGRPVLGRRISCRIAAAVVAAIMALLIAAPPTVARLPSAAIIAQTSR
ncbi:MAG: hypothetical protein ACRDNK_15995 [Solirubrobacteraceae bacterium]